MKPQILSLLSVFFVAAIVGCGSDSGSSAGESSSSTSSSSAESSSSLSNRLDVAYADTLSSDTLSVSCKAGSDACKLFLGEYPAGTLIEIFAMKASGESPDSFFVREEQGANLVPETFSIDAGDTVYNTQDAFARFGDTSFVTARFITTQGSGFYYVDVPAASARDSASEFLMAANVLVGHYLYAEGKDSTTIAPGDTLRGFFLLESAPKEAVVRFSVSVGKSINVKAFGKSISGIDLQKDGKEVVSGNPIDEQILPEKKADYAVAVYPKGAPDYTTGPYAYFEIQTSSRDLAKGEYLANPDSIKTVGDTLVVVREKNDAAKYYLRQEQYVWLADLDKGDSIQVSHEIEGYYSGASYPATYAILDSAGDSVASVSETRRLFVAEKKGPFYLHYVRLNSPPSSPSQILTLKTSIERFGYVTRFFFYDEEREESIETKSVLAGDTLYFSRLALRAEPSDASSNAIWYVPCEDLDLIRSAYTESSCLSYGTEQLIGATNIAVSSDPNSAGEIIHLIAQSLADPHARDTLNVFISDSDSP